MDTDALTVTLNTIAVPLEGSPREQLEARLQVLAALFQTTDVHQVDVGSLLNEGFLIKIHIGRTRFKKKLSFEDLGLTFPNTQEGHKTSQTMERLIRLGNIALIPRPYLLKLDALESSARKCLDAHCYETQFGKFLPLTAWESWNEKNEAYKQQYYEIQEAILKDYTRLRMQMIREFTVASQNAYRIIHQFNPDHLTPKQREREQEYLKEARRQFWKRIPSQETIRRSFSYTVSLGLVDWDGMQRKAAEMQHVAHKLVEEQPLTPSELTLNDQLSYQEELHAAATRRQAYSAYLAQAQEQKEREVDQVLNELVTHTRGIMYGACMNVLSALEAGKDLHHKHVEQLQNMLRTLRDLNFYQDREISTMAKKVEAVLGQSLSKEGIDLAALSNCLRNISLVTRSTLLSLDYAFREDREEEDQKAVKEREARLLAELPDRPSYLEVLDAREALELDTDNPLLLPARTEREETYQPASIHQRVLTDDRQW